MEKLFTILTKLATLMRRSTVPTLPLRLLFPVELPKGLSKYLRWKILFMEASLTLMTGFSSALLYG
jgi:hypothetical protein